MKRIALFVICVLITVSTDAQLLWRITGNGMEKPSYLFGTYHIAPFSLVDSIEGLASAISNVDKVYGEVVASDMLNPDTLAYMAQRLTLPGDTTLAGLLSPQEFSTVETFLENNLKLSLDDINMAKMLPVAVTNQITVLTTERSSGLRPFQSARCRDSGAREIAGKRGRRD